MLPIIFQGQQVRGAKCNKSPGAGVYVSENTMRIFELRLATNCLPNIRDFYVNLLEFPMSDETPDSLTLNAGQSRLVFEKGDSAQYHIAFNIPENQFAEAKRWTGQRVPLMKLPDGFDEIHWKAWKAHALYFFDPAGNIMEFIARHNLPNATNEPFSAKSICQVSEIGLPVASVRETVNTLQTELGIGVFDAGDGEHFTALGDDNGLLIVVKQGRAWFPTSDMPADFYPLALIINGATGKQLRLSGLPYEIETRQTSSI